MTTDESDATDTTDESKPNRTQGPTTATAGAIAGPSGIPETDPEDTTECPACESEVSDADLLDGGCPKCGATTDDLFLVGAGLKTAEEARQR